LFLPFGQPASRTVPGAESHPGVSPGTCPSGFRCKLHLANSLRSSYAKGQPPGGLILSWHFPDSSAGAPARFLGGEARGLPKEPLFPTRRKRLAKVLLLFCKFTGSQKVLRFLGVFGMQGVFNRWGLRGAKQPTPWPGSAPKQREGDLYAAI